MKISTIEVLEAELIKSKEKEEKIKPQNIYNIEYMPILVTRDTKGKLKAIRQIGVAEIFKIENEEIEREEE